MNANEAVTDEESAPPRSRRPLLRAGADWGALVLTTVSRVYLLFTLTLVATAVIPALISWDTFIVRSGSMAPGIKTGDVILTAPLDPEEEVQAGHVFTFVDPAKTSPAAPDIVLVHRIVEQNDDGTFMTAGDANREHDSTPVPRAAFLGRGRILVPLLGRPSLWLATGNDGALALLVIVSVAAMAFGVPVRGDRPQRRPRPLRGSVRLLPRVVAGGAVAAALSCAALAMAVAGFTGSTRNAADTWALASFIDITPPTLDIAFPVADGASNAAGWNAGCASKICGTARDERAGLAGVRVSIRQGTSNYWNGTSFAGGEELLQAATGTTTWSYPLAAGTFPADGLYTIRVVAIDAARSSNTTSVLRTFTYDGTAPSGGFISYADGYAGASSMPITLANGADTGTGIKSAATQLQRASATLSAGACGSFGPFAGIGPASPSSPYVDSTLVSGTCYRYQYLVPDKVGNVATYTSGAVVRLDTTPPAAPGLTFSSLTSAFYKVAGTTLYLRPSADGAFTVTAAAGDAESGIRAGPAGYAFGSLNTDGGANFSNVQTAGSNAYAFGASTTAPAGTVTVSAVNNAGASSAAAGYSIVLDTVLPVAPTPTVTASYYTSASVPVTVGSATDTGSGVSAVVLQRDRAPLSGGVCGAFPGTFATTVVLAGGRDTAVASGFCHQYRLRVTDNVGNQATSAVSGVAKVDTSAPPTPTLTFSAMTNVGASVTTVSARTSQSSGSFTVTAGSADAETGVVFTFPTFGTPWTTNRTAASATYSWPSSNPGVPAGNHTVTVTNAAGLLSTASFTVVADNLNPALTDIVMADGPGVAGGLDPGDTITLTFSEDMAASKFCPAWTNGTVQTLADLVVTVDNRGGHDNIFVTSASCPALNLLTGAASLNTNSNYVNSSIATFNGSVVWRPAARTITITFATLRSGGAGLLNGVSSGRLAKLGPPPGLTDVAGNGLPTSTVTAATPSGF